MKPPAPPGPGLEWVEIGEFVASETRQVIAWLDDVIAGLPEPERRIALAKRDHLAEQLAAYVRLHLEHGAKQ